MTVLPLLPQLGPGVGLHGVQVLREAELVLAVVASLLPLVAEGPVREVRREMEVLQLPPGAVPGAGGGLAEDGAGEPGALGRIMLYLLPTPLRVQEVWEYHSPCLAHLAGHAH